MAMILGLVVFLNCIFSGNSNPLWLGILSGGWLLAILLGEFFWGFYMVLWCIFCVVECKRRIFSSFWGSDFWSGGIVGYRLSAIIWPFYIQSCVNCGAQVDFINIYMCVCVYVCVYVCMFMGLSDKCLWLTVVFNHLGNLRYIYEEK